MLSIIYPYRNREIKAFKNSLESLKRQTCYDFKVYVADYGSDIDRAREVKLLCEHYPFLDYEYFPARFQPWNKSRALNALIKQLKTDFCFVADMDMIFHPQFIEKALSLQEKDKTVYFQVGFLKPNKNVQKGKFEDFKHYQKSTPEATGLSMFPVTVLKELRGFDEFYHFWGAEDTDMHARIKNAGYQVEFYAKKVLLLHQWHPSYRSKNQDSLTQELRLSGIVKLNHEHLKNAIKNKIAVANHGKWGECITESDVRELENEPVNLILNNRKEAVDHFLYVQLPLTSGTVLKANIIEDVFQNSAKYRIKKALGKKVPQYYSLKEINDTILLHLISFYRDVPYSFKISKELDQIEVAVKL